MTTSVWRAFFHAGSLNAGTPLEMASTPVTAAPPDAKALASTYAVAPSHEARTRPRRARSRRCPPRSWRDDREVAAEVLHEPVAQQHRHVEHEEVRGDGEDLPALLHAAQVAVHHDRDERRARSAPVHGLERVERRDERGRARRHRHGHGEDVADEQRRAGHLGGDDAEVVAGDEVGAAGRRVRLDRLPVGQDQQAEHHQQGDGDRHHQREGGQAHERAPGRGGSPPWRRRSTRGCRTRTRPARWACRGAGGRARRCGAAARGACA